jgi:uncharacterized ion transporter superfamily protein YfcC
MSTHGGKSETNETKLSRFDEESSSLLSKDNAEDKDESEKKDVPLEDAFTRNLKLVFCFLGLQISYVLWGVAQEQIMTQVYKPGKFTSSTVRKITLLPLCLSMSHNLSHE